MPLIVVALLVLLPVIVAVFELGVLLTLLLVLALLGFAWLRVLNGFRERPECRYRLETIQASHYVEKVRLCMDRLGVNYVEERWAATLGAFYLGRTVPRLHVRTGNVWSSLGNSSDILRYLWAVHANDSKAGFLEPTPQRLELESKIDHVGSMLQVWLYDHLLDRPDTLLHVWGVNDPAVPAWQKAAIRILLPVQRRLIRKSFRITPDNTDKATHRIEAFLDESEARLADGRKSLLGDDDLNFTDYAFAGILGLWIRPTSYGGPNHHHVFLEDDMMPRAMRDTIERWRQDHPKTVAFVETLYERPRRTDDA